MVKIAHSFAVCDFAFLMTSGAAGTVAAAAAFFAPPAYAADSGDNGTEDTGDQQVIGKIHNTPPRMRRTSRVTTQAMAHCHRTTPTAHLLPSSRRTAAMAATQGV